jgi:hypothetical protein
VILARNGLHGLPPLLLDSKHMLQLLRVAEFSSLLFSLICIWIIVSSIIAHSLNLNGIGMPYSWDSKSGIEKFTQDLHTRNIFK